MQRERFLLLLLGLLQMHLLLHVLVMLHFEQRRYANTHTSGVYVWHVLLLLLTKQHLLMGRQGQWLLG